MDFVLLFSLFLCLSEIFCSKYKEHKKGIRSCHSVTSVKNHTIISKVKSQTNK